MGFNCWGISRRILVTEEVGRTSQNYLLEHLIKIGVRVEGTEHVKFQKLGQDMVKSKVYRKQEWTHFWPCNKMASNFKMESGCYITYIRVYRDQSVQRSEHLKTRGCRDQSVFKSRLGGGEKSLSQLSLLSMNFFTWLFVEFAFIWNPFHSWLLIK